MGPFNRNVITDVNVRNLLAPDKGTPRTLDEAQPTGDIPAVPGAVPQAVLAPAFHLLVQAPVKVP